MSAFDDICRATCRERCAWGLGHVRFLCACTIQTKDYFAPDCESEKVDGFLAILEAAAIRGLGPRMATLLWSTVYAVLPAASFCTHVAAARRRSMVCTCFTCRCSTPFCGTMATTILNEMFTTGRPTSSMNSSRWDSVQLRYTEGSGVAAYT